MARAPTIYSDIAFAVVDCLALLLTLLRLAYRLHIRRFWWEDAWAAVAFVCGTGFITTQYISAATVHPRTAFVTVWMTNVFSKTALLAVRMSILYSIIRIMPQWLRIRIFARMAGIVFIVFWASSLILKFTLCRFNERGKLMSAGGRQPVKCNAPKLIAVFQVTIDWVSDAILVILPLKLLWRVKLPRRQRRMILTLFASSAIISIFSLIHNVFQLLPKYVFQFTLSYNLEMMLALFVCNLLVVVTYLYQKIHGSGPGDLDDTFEDDDFTTPTPVFRTTEALTTVDLDTGITSSDSRSSKPRSATSKKGLATDGSDVDRTH